MVPRVPIVLAMLTASTVLLAGCFGGGEIYSFVGSGTPADKHDTFKAGDNIRLSVAAGGAGTAKVTLKDGGGSQVFAQTFGGNSYPGGSANGSGGCGSASGGAPGSGGSSFSCTIDGKSGTWTVDIDFTGYSGGFTLSVTGA